MKRKEMHEIIDKYSLPLGFGGWKLYLEEGFTKLDEEAAAAFEVDICEKTLRVTLSTTFENRDDDSQKNVLIHELMHARKRLFDQKVQVIRTEEEESMINDFVNCVEEALRK